MYLNSTNQADSRDPVKKTFVDSNTMFIFSYYHENIVDIGGIVLGTIGSSDYWADTVYLLVSKGFRQILTCLILFIPMCVWFFYEEKV
jgi:hypothetical protein